ncbi:hypothetical protein SB766_23845, partial [Pseudomonas sp. SIMBA_077]
MTMTLINSVTTESLTDLLQGAGYRVNQTEQNGIVQLLSASQGIGYAYEAIKFGRLPLMLAGGAEE